MERTKAVFNVKEGDKILEKLSVHYNCPASTKIITRSIIRSLSLAS